MGDPCIQDVTRAGDSREGRLARFKELAMSLLRGGAAAGAVAMSLAPALPGCVPEGETMPPEDPGTGSEVEGGGGKADWAHDQGRRDTSMVRYDGGSWAEYGDCHNRGGCMTATAFLKVFVKRADGASLDEKRIGVNYRVASSEEVKTAVGRYYGEAADGFEEWHVPVTMRAWEGSFMRFNAWYQDGRGNTFYDDNEGEFHVAYWGSAPLVWHGWADNETKLDLDDAGVRGKISVRIADLDFDKDIRLVYTTDGWATLHELGMGAADEKNRWHWVEDQWGTMELWSIDLELDAPGVERFEYAVVYRHGVKNGAKVYEFWDNNGGWNHTVQRQRPPPLEVE